MSKTYRMCVVLLSAAMVIAVSDSRSAFGQRIKVGVGSNQGGDKKDKKDRDDDKDRNDKKDQKDQSGQGNPQGNPGSQNNDGQGGKPNDSNTPPSANKSGSQQVQQFFKNQQGQGKGPNTPGQGGNQNPNFQGQGIQGQGGQNKFNGNKIGIPGQQFQQQQNQKSKDFKFDDDDDHDHKKMNFGSWRGDKWEGSNKAENWARAFGYRKTSLFGDKWYQNHPQAWHYNNNKSNIWVAATVPGMYSWLGWGNVPQQYQAYYSNSPQFDASRYGEWYPLGVYSLMSDSNDMGTRIVQLAVDRHGHLAGTYFDMITDAEHSIVGDIGRQSQRAEWSLRKNPDVQFSASIYRLLQPSGYVTVRLPGGDQRWQFVRLEN